mmetsp:Transcript_91425/g.258902  ORF Transcript_91425/g.258902 Transcript_91425/m.258902 type:complete len:285 (-) Transcript_91425:1436-2290(-)
MRHGLAAAVQLPDPVIKEEVKAELADGHPRCRESWCDTVVAQAFVPGSRHGYGVPSVAPLEANVSPSHPRNLKLHKSNQLVLQALLVHVRRRRLECDVLRHQLAELREHALRLHAHAAALADLELQDPNGPVERGVRLFVWLQLPRCRPTGVDLRHDPQPGAFEPLPGRGFQEDELGQQRREVLLQELGDRPLSLPHTLQLVEQLQQVRRVFGVELLPRGAVLLGEAYVVDPRLLVDGKNKATKLVALHTLILGSYLLPEQLNGLVDASRGAKVVGNNELVLPL